MLRKNYKLLKESRRKYMRKHFFDDEDGDFAYAISDNMAIAQIQKVDD